MKKYLRRADIMRRYGIGRSTSYDWEKQGVLPKPIMMGGTPIFDPDELDAADEKCKLQRDQSQKRNTQG
jgi:predicted DNA-binding transcriptional regulator AlpA